MQYRRAAVGLTVALALVGILVYGVGWEEVWTLLQGANPVYVAAAFAAGVGIITLRGAVVSRLLEPVAGGATGRGFVLAFLAGYFARSALPWGRSTGSPVMAFLLAKNSDSRFEDNLAVVALAELFVGLGSLAVGLIGVVAFFGFGSNLGRLEELIGTESITAAGNGLPSAELLTGLALALLAVSLIVYARGRPANLRATAYTLSQYADRPVRYLPRVTRPDPVSSRLEGFIRTLETVSAARRTLAVALGIGFASWLVNVLPLYFALLALGVDGSLALAVLCAPLATVGGIIPLPGGTGGMETVLVVLLVTLGGLPADLATAVTLLYRLTTYWLHLTIGGTGALFLSVRGEHPLTV